MRFRKPELIPLLFIIGAVSLLSSLGVWQIERLQWKNGLVAEIKEAQSEPPLTTLPALPQGLDFRKAKLTGVFLNDKTLHTIGAAPGIGGNSVAGFHIVTPFRLEHDGRVILVDRGFAPAGKEGKPEGIQTASGIIRPPHPANYFLPDNRPDRNIWFSDDLAAMARTTGLPLTPVIIEEVGPQKPGVYPVPSDGTITLRNDHLQYAITWFSLAIIGIVMFAAYHRVKE